MEMEHIDENTIRVTISHDELSERGVTLWDLLSNRKQMEEFFYNILEEVDTEHAFVGNDTVTFQVLPGKDGMLDMIISKNNGGIVPEQLLKKLVSANGEVPSELSKLMKDTNTTDTKAQPDAKTTPEQTKDDEAITDISEEMVVKFNDFEDFLALANNFEIDEVKSDLYVYRGQFYAHIQVYPNQLNSEIKAKLALVYEYADNAPTTAAMLAEHGKLLMADTAFEQARYYFGH